jgi:hypothetical protein
MNELLVTAWGLPEEAETHPFQCANHFSGLEDR